MDLLASLIVPSKAPKNPENVPTPTLSKTQDPDTLDLSSSYETERAPKRRLKSSDIVDSSNAEHSSVPSCGRATNLAHTSFDEAMEETTEKHANAALRNYQRATEAQAVHPTTNQADSYGQPRFEIKTYDDWVAERKHARSSQEGEGGEKQLELKNDAARVTTNNESSETGNFVTELYNFCQKRHKLLPEVSYMPVLNNDSSIRFTATVKISDQSFSSNAAHGNKKLAKTDACRNALNHLKSEYAAEWTANQTTSRVGHGTVAPASKSVVSELYEFCQQKKGFMPIIDFEYNVNGGGFSGSVMVGEMKLNGPTKPTKQAAKEAACTQMLEALRDGKVDAKNGEEDVSWRDWVDVLSKQAVKAGCSEPTYNISETSSGNAASFSVMLTHPMWPEEAFAPGDQFSSKETAKQAAAELAVKWLEERGGFNAKPGAKPAPTQKRKTSGSGQPQPASDAPLGKSAPPGNSAPPNDRTITPSASGQSHASTAATLATSLALPPPTYNHVKQDAPPAGGTETGPYWTVTAHFPSMYVPHTVDDPAATRPHGAEVARAENVFGKAKAKEECARHVVEWLRELERKRLSVLDG